MKLKTILLMASLVLPVATNAAAYATQSSDLKTVRSELNEHGIHHNIWSSNAHRENGIKSIFPRASITMEHAAKSQATEQADNLQAIAKALIGRYEVYPLTDNVIEKLEGDVKHIHKLKNLYEKRRLTNVNKLANSMIAKNIYRNHALIIIIDNHLRHSDFEQAFVFAQVGYILNDESTKSSLGAEFAKRIDLAAENLNGDQVLKAYNKAVLKSKTLKKSITL